MTPQAPAHTERYWLQIISQMGGDVAMHLSAVQAHLEALGPSLPPSSELQKLQERLARVRQIGMLGQQLARMAAGEVHQVPEEISLTTVLREVLAQQKARARCAASNCTARCTRPPCCWTPACCTASSSS
jgi:hypothetical protein